MRVKLKAAQLLRRLEQIDRDLEELDRIRNTIKDDRNYAERLRTSLSEEMVRLKEVQTRILSQVVKDPPSSLFPGGMSTDPLGEPEITLPHAQPGKAASSQPANDGAETAKTTRTEKKRDDKNKRPGEKSGNFQFRYN